MLGYFMLVVCCMPGYSMYISCLLYTGIFYVSCLLYSRIIYVSCMFYAGIFYVSCLLYASIFNVSCLLHARIFYIIGCFMLEYERLVVHVVVSWSIPCFLIALLSVQEIYKDRYDQLSIACLDIPGQFSVVCSKIQCKMLF